MPIRCEVQVCEGIRVSKAFAGFFRLVSGNTRPQRSESESFAKIEERKLWGQEQ